MEWVLAEEGAVPGDAGLAHMLRTFHLEWPVGNFLRLIIGGGGTQLVAARALAPKLQGRSLYCLRPLDRVYRIRAGKA